jgi:predicted transcriptional regulator
VHKLSEYLRIRITDDENQRLDRLAQDLSADRSSLVRLALKRMFRQPPVRRFRFRTRRGAKP